MKKDEGEKRVIQESALKDVQFFHTVWSAVGVKEEYLCMYLVFVTVACILKEMMFSSVTHVLTIVSET